MHSIKIRKVVSVQVCVCVNHLNRCKTSTRFGVLECYCFYSRGTIHVLCAMVQRSGHSTCGHHGWSPWRTCLFIFRYGTGLSREPYPRHFWYFSTGTIARLSMHAFISTGTTARQFSQEPSFDFPCSVHRSKIPARLPQSACVSFILIVQRLVRTEPSDSRMS